MLCRGDVDGCMRARVSRARPLSGAFQSPCVKRMVANSAHDARAHALVCACAHDGKQWILFIQHHADALSRSSLRIGEPAMFAHPARAVSQPDHARISLVAAASSSFITMNLANADERFCPRALSSVGQLSFGEVVFMLLRFLLPCSCL